MVRGGPKMVGDERLAKKQCKIGPKIIEDDPKTAGDEWLVLRQ